jgi:hypothetical protein
MIPNEDFEAASVGPKPRTKPASFWPPGCWPIRVTASHEVMWRPRDGSGLDGVLASSVPRDVIDRDSHDQ